MRQFCPSCDAEVEVSEGQRCPTCHKAVQPLAAPAQPAAKRSLLPLVAGGLVVAAIERGDVLACQFHPELSGAWGAALLGRWVEGRC